MLCSTAAGLTRQRNSTCVTEVSKQSRSAYTIPLIVKKSAIPVVGRDLLINELVIWCLSLAARARYLVGDWTYAGEHGGRVRVRLSPISRASRIRYSTVSVVAVSTTNNKQQVTYIIFLYYLMYVCIYFRYA